MPVTKKRSVNSAKKRKNQTKRVGKKRSVKIVRRTKRNTKQKGGSLGKRGVGKRGVGHRGAFKIKTQQQQQQQQLLLTPPNSNSNSNPYERNNPLWLKNIQNQKQNELNELQKKRKNLQLIRTVEGNFNIPKSTGPTEPKKPLSPSNMFTDTSF